MILIFDEAHNITDLAEEELKRMITSYNWNEFKQSVEASVNVTDNKSISDINLVKNREHFNR